MFAEEYFEGEVKIKCILTRCTRSGERHIVVGVRRHLEGEGWWSLRSGALGRETRERAEDLSIRR